MLWPVRSLLPRVVTSSFRAQPGALIDRYVVEGELGSGATSIVYRARDGESGEIVAIKVLRPELVESLSAERFLREVRLTQALTHPNIVPVIGSGAVDGSLYCVFRWMTGGTLREWLNRDRQLPVDTVLEIGVQIARALDFAHLRKLIHRDVKPENILFNDGDALLGDFGIARALEGAGGGTTSTGIIRGTPAYMSPEQASGEREYDGRSDIFSLACVLYEALAGVPAYVGANSQSVAAQRLAHAPRPIGVYRPAAGRSVERVLAKALSLAPADRFGTAGEFADALERARSDVRDQAHDARRVPRRAILVAVAVCALSIAAAWAARTIDRSAAPAALDTTQIVVFRLDAPAPDAGVAAQQQLSRAIARWRGVRPADLLQLGDVIRDAQPANDEGARGVARRLSIGRYIRGRITSSSNSPSSRSSVYAALYDVNAGRLAEATALEFDASDAERVYNALVDSLLLRGVDAGDESASGRLNLPAIQQMARGSRALNDWDLVAADSEFRRASQFDSAARRPLLWRAQVREWALRPSAEWLPLAREALLDTLSLSSSERLMGAALVGLGTREYPRACLSYEALIARDSASFAGWYGLGECITQDKVVVPDSRSRTGWRFRSSYHRGLQAYARAFDLLPATFRGFQGNAYARLRTLFTSTSFRQGRTSTQPIQTLWARVALVGDTIVVVPAPQSEFREGKSPVDLQDNARGIVYLRGLFRRIATTWGTAFPRSAEAKQAVAVALELQGDPAAVDSLRAAERLAGNSPSRRRLIAERVLVEAKFALPSDHKTLDDAYRTADSLLDSRGSVDADAAAALAPLAALIGRCDLAVDLVRRSARPISSAVDVPASLAGDIHARMAIVAMGCPEQQHVPTVEQIGKSLAALGPADAVKIAEGQLLPLIVALSSETNLTWIDQLATDRDYVLSARRQLAAHRPDSVRAILKRIDQARRQALAGSIAPDAVLPEAVMYLSIGDTATATRVLDDVLGSARSYGPLGTGEDAWREVVWVGSLVRSMELRGRLPRTATSEPTAWAGAVSDLWRKRAGKSKL